jgi:hypothetical protein
MSSGSTSDAKTNCQTAIEWFGKAEKRHPLTFLREEWAKCLEALGNPNEAKHMRDSIPSEASH